MAAETKKNQLHPPLQAIDSLTQSFWESNIHSNKGSQEDLVIDDESIAPSKSTDNVQETRRKSLSGHTIDTSSFLGVKVVRKIFDKGTGLPLPGGKINDSKSMAHYKLNSSSRPRIKSSETVGDEPITLNSLTGIPHDAPILPHDLNSDWTQDNTANESPNNPSMTEDLSDEELYKRAKQKKCEEGLDVFRKREPANILILNKKLDSGEDNKLYIKQALLEFNAHHRVIVMIRDEVERFISLNKVWKIDISSTSLNIFEKYLKKSLQRSMNNSAMSLYFTTTPNPMIIVLKDPFKRDALLKLILFLRDLHPATCELEIVQ